MDAVDQALDQCGMYVKGHPVPRRMCRTISRWMWRHFRVLPEPGTIGQVVFRRPANFLCFDVICVTKPSLTLSLCGRAEDYAGLHLDDLLAPARPGSVRLRTQGPSDGGPVIRACFRAAALRTGQTGQTGPLTPGTTLPPKRRRKRGNPPKNGPMPPDGPGAPLPSPTSSNTAGPPDAGKKDDPPKPAQPEANSEPRDPSPAPLDELARTLAADPGVLHPSVGDLAVPKPRISGSSPPPGPPNPPGSSGPPGSGSGNGSGGEPAGPLSRETIRSELSRIVISLAGKAIPALTRAAADIRRLRPHIAPYPDLAPELHQAVLIWRFTRQFIERKWQGINQDLPPYEATEILPSGMVIPSRPAQLGGRKDPLPPPEMVRQWLDTTFATEDATRQFCCFTLVESHPKAQTLPLLWIGRVPIEGAKIAPLYREGRIQRPWDPGWRPDFALLHDFIIVMTLNASGRWTPTLARTCILRLRPHLRGIPDDSLMAAGSNAVGFLEGQGLMHQRAHQTWELLPEGLKIYYCYIGPAWLAACRASGE